MIQHEKRAYFQGLVSHPPILRIQGPGSAIRVPPLPSPCCWLPAGASGIVRTGKIGAKSHRFQPAKGNSYPTATSISVSSTLVPAPLFEEGHFSQLMYYWLLGTVIAVTMTKIIIKKISGTPYLKRRWRPGGSLGMVLLTHAPSNTFIQTLSPNFNHLSLIASNYKSVGGWIHLLGQSPQVPLIYR